MIVNLMSNIITTRRLTLRPRTSRDFDDCLAMDRDPVVTQHIAGPWQDPVCHHAFMSERMSLKCPHPFGYWTVTKSDEPENFLGWVMMVPEDDTLNIIETGWRLTKETWGQGIATEAVTKLFEVVRAAQPDVTIFAGIHPDNKGSINVAKKAGMVLDREEFIDGQREHIFLYNAAYEELG